MDMSSVLSRWYSSMLVVAVAMVATAAATTIIATAVAAQAAVDVMLHGGRGERAAC